MTWIQISRSDLDLNCLQRSSETTEFVECYTSQHERKWPISCTISLFFQIRMHANAEQAKGPGLSCEECVHEPDSEVAQTTLIIAISHSSPC